MTSIQQQLLHDRRVTSTLPSTDEVVESYVRAKRAVVDHGFVDEIAWQAEVALTSLTATRFLREAAWVVLSAGMAEVVIRRVFKPLSRVFAEFEPSYIVARQAEVRAEALSHFGHERKIDAILSIAHTVVGSSSEDLYEYLVEPEMRMQTLPYIGPVTWRHLAKNLGVAVAKPDRHMVRLCNALDRESVDSLCREIADWTGDSVDVVDIVLWRWSVLRGSDCSTTCHFDGGVFNPLPSQAPTEGSHERRVLEMSR